MFSIGSFHPSAQINDETTVSMNDTLKEVQLQTWCFVHADVRYREELSEKGREKT